MIIKDTVFTVSKKSINSIPGANVVVGNGGVVTCVGQGRL